MPFCRECGKEVQADWVTCPFCSQSIGPPASNLIGIQDTVVMGDVSINETTMCVNCKSTGVRQKTCSNCNELSYCDVCESEVLEGRRLLLANHTPHVYYFGPNAKSNGYILEGTEFGRVCTPCYIIERDANTSICENCYVMFGIVGSGKFRHKEGEKLCHECAMSFRLPEPFTGRDAELRRKSTLMERKQTTSKADDSGPKPEKDSKKPRKKVPKKSISRLNRPKISRKKKDE